MKKILSILGLITILFFAFYLESSGNSYHGFSTNLGDEPNQDATATEVSGQDEEQVIESYSSLEYIFEEAKEVDGYVVETYQEYEIYKDEEGETVKREPSGNFEYLRYKK